jgi:NAD(P)-dependent dehydrogenase (short-subunit alcohol dehydrogenase family)
MQFTSKVALATGGSSGLGFAIAQAFAGTTFTVQGSLPLNIYGVT